MPPMWQYEEPHDINSEYVAPVETSPQAQGDTDAIARRASIAMPRGNSGSESDKYTCPPWSWHCRPHDPLPTNATGAVSTSAQGNINPIIRRDGMAMPRGDSGLESGKYTCPPWSWHCRPQNPLPIDKIVAGVPSENHTGNGTGSKTIINKRTDLNPEKGVLPVTATISTASPPVVSSPAWPGPNIAGTGPGEAIQVRSKGISKSKIEGLCILHKDVVTGMLVEKCEPEDRGGVPELAKRNDHDDLLAKILDQGPQPLGDSKCFLAFEPGSHKIMMTFPSGGSMKLETTFLHPTGSSAHDNECKSPTGWNAVVNGNWDIIAYLTISCLACLAYIGFNGYKRRNRHMKKLEKRQQSKASKHTYSVDTMSLPTSSDGENKTLPTMV